MPDPGFRIEADVLIPGRGDPIKDGCVVLDGDQIAYAGPRSGAPDTSGRFPAVEVPVVMPGLWDCHTHLTGLTRTSLEDSMRVPVPVAAARAVRDAELALDAGYTSIREVGGYGVYIARVIDEGTARGPTIYAAGDLISQTGGHADLHSYSVGCMVDLGTRGGWLHTCDGEAECLRAVRLQLRRNARLVKICASGGVLTEFDHPMHQQFTDHELRTIVEEAARAERVVAAHCHGKAGIMAAVRAGVATVEHGTYLDEEAAEAMKEAGTILVTTRFVKVRMLAHGKRTGLPDYAYKKLVDTADVHREAIALAIRSGVRIAAGTDSITTGADTALPWGLHALELELLVECGMTPLDAIAAATAEAPATIGPQAPDTGQLREGFDADVIAVAVNPIDDIATLQDRDNITHVWKGGRLAKGALPG
jgi:imidazolonepropionase-like amidohydrolase